MTKLLLGVAFLAWTSSAAAKPVYLDCSTVYGGDPPNRFSVTLDEETGRVTATNATGYAFNADGFFSADEVSFKNVDCQRVTCMTVQYTINRRTLEATKTIRIEATNPNLGLPPKDIVSTGTCQLRQIEDRKF